MTVNLSALAGAGAQFLDGSGNPLTGGKLYSYQAGTTTPQTTYTNATGTIAHSNPIILDSAGRVPTGEIWITAGANYKFVLSDSNDVVIATYDNITGINGTGIATNASAVAYDPAGLGAITTNVQEKLRQTISVKDFGAVGDGITDDTIAIQNALNNGGVVSGSGKTYAVTSRLFVNNPVTLIDINLVAVGSGWASNTANVDTDTVGLPMITVSSAFTFQNLELDCGLKSIDAVNNTIAASGIVFNDGSQSSHGDNFTIRFYLGYGVWTRGRCGDSKFSKIRLAQWSFGSPDPGWVDPVNRRTAYGWANTSGDFHVDQLVSNYNKANIYCTTDCFTTQWTSIHPYNGNGTLAILNNIVINGGSGQTFTNVYLDNGQIVLEGSFVHQFNGVRGVLVGTRMGQYAGFDLVATQPDTTGNGLIINGFQFATNVPVRFSTSGSGTWVEQSRRTCIINNVVRNTPFLSGETNTSYYLGKGYRVAFSDDSVNLQLTPNETEITVVGNVPHIIQLSSDSTRNGLSVQNYSATSTTNVPAIRFGKARSKDLTAQPLSGDVLGLIAGYGSIGGSTGSTAFPSNQGSGQLRFVATNDFTPTSTPVALQVWLTPSGSTTTSRYYDFNQIEFRPNTDGTINLGSAGFKWDTVFAATGSINTSDARQKQDIDDISEIEKQVAIKIKGLFKKYRFQDAVSTKGEAARIHFGVIAQEVIDAFASEGLDATKYGLLCYDEWQDQYEMQEIKPAVVDEDGNVLEEAQEKKVLVKPAGNSYGVRYDELFAFVIGAM